jgi:nucleoside-diphosphate-sugar epimerase
LIKTVILGAGYIGKSLLHYWATEGRRRLTVTTTSPNKVRELSGKTSKVILAKSDNEEALKGVLTSAEEVVISIAPKNGSSYKSTYLNTAKTLCSALKENNSIKKLVYLSSTSIYGDRNGEWTSEDALLNPISENGQILSKTEKLYLNKFQSKVSVTILRLSGLYGPGRTHESRIRRLSGGLLPGSGEDFCNWVHQEDVVRAIDWVLKNQLSGIYNICCDDHPTKKEFYNSFSNKMKLSQINWDINKISLRKGNRRVSNSKIKKTGFNFLHSSTK